MKWTKEENNRLRENYQLRKKELLKLFPGRSASAVNQRASLLKLRKDHNEYCESEPSVLLEDSHLAYYWLGFILADGHINGKYRLTITLAVKDADHIKRFSNFVKCKNIKPQSKGRISVSLQDKCYIKQFKEKFDIHQRKTYNPPKFDIADDNLFLSMLIGYIDGDGCIKKQTGRKDCCLSIHIHSSWLGWLTSVIDRISKIVKIEQSKPIIGKDGYARVNITNSEVLKFLKRHGKNNRLPVLNRKWKLIDLRLVSRYRKAHLRKKNIVELYQKGVGQKDIALKLKLSRPYISIIISKFKSNSMPNKNYRIVS